MRLSRLFAYGCTIAAITPVLLPVNPVAAATGERVVYVADSFGSDDGYYGLYTTTGDFGTTPSTVIAENGTVDVLQAKLSPDGSQIAALVDLAGTFDYSLLVMNVDGAHRRTVLAAAHSATTSTQATGFSWSADSSRLVFGQFTFNGTAAFKLRSYTLATGAIADIANGAELVDPAVASDGRVAAVDNTSGALVVLDPSTGTRTATGVTSSSDSVESPSWSADGASLAYVDDTANDSADQSTINVITNSGSGWSAPAVVAPATSGSNTWFNEYPTFDSDGTIWFDRYDDTTTPGAPQDVVTATPAGGGAWTLTPHSTAASDGGVSFGALDATAPVAPTLQAFTLAGTTTFLHWSTSDVDVSRLNVHRTGSDGSAVDFVAKTSPFADKTTKIGVTYTYTATATDGAGNTGPASAARTVTAAGVKIALSNPTSLTSAKLPFAVSWGVAGNRAVSYTVQYAPAGGSVRNWLPTTTATKGSFSPSAGQTYQFRALVKDTYGNSSALTAWSKAVVPFDQTKGTFSSSPSWRVTKSTADWLGSIKTTTHNKATATFKLTSRGVQIIGDKLASGAKFAVYVGKTYKGTFTTRAATTKHRQVLYSATFSSLATRTIKIVAVVATGKVLKIDAVGAPK